ncbi:flavodoxin family protein [uncultured Sphingosinicella sp.]|uniref:flavodoxin family protein n=1 Tax=uncultured Sphingosinicella sp. TaxID=478748 RepID=UPI0030D95105
MATMTGTAEICAEEISTALGAAGIESEMQLMDSVGTDALRAFEFVVIVSSTYGHGDIPDNGQALFEALGAADNLAGIRFTVFGLGDRTYAATFCEAGRKWDALFAEKGASRFAPLVQHDAGSGTLAEDVAGAWAAEWAAQLRQAA